MAKYQTAFLAGAAISALAVAAPAAAQERDFNIRSQSATTAIPEFARQARIQIVAPADTLVGVVTPSIRGSRDIRVALAELLRGSGLEIVSDNGRVIVLRRVPQGSAAEFSAAEPEAEIIVTGSRIQGAGSVTAAPVAQLRGDSVVTRSGSISIGDQLSLLPQFRTSGTQAASTALGTQAPGQVGINLLDLRGLGPTRTLVLQNGRRLVSSTQQISQPDTNTIPAELIDRVDILTGGASSVYGADAIAGVVNFVLKQDYEGLSLHGQAGISDRGDAGARTIGLVAGHNFASDRANVAIALEYAQRDGLRYTDREFSNGQSDFIQNPLAAQAGQPLTIPINDIRFLSYSNGGTLPYGPPFYRFQPNGTLAPANTGTASYPNLGISDGGDGYGPIEAGSLLPDNERFSGTLLAHFGVTDAITLFGQADVIWQRSSAFSGPLIQQFVFSKTNPYLSSQALGVLNAYGPTAAGPDFVAVRALTDVGTFGERDTRETYRGVIGAKGELSDHLRYELSYSYGRTNVETNFFNNVIIPRTTLAADAVIDTAGVLGTVGAIVCRSRLNAPTSTNPDIAGCAPANFFGNGAVTPAARDYLAITTTSRGRLQQHLAGGFLAGDTGGFLTLPGGAIGFVVGAEFRRESTRYTPDPRDTLGRTQSGGAGVAGSVEVVEAYGELKIPVLADLPFARRLELGVSGRLSDYNLSRVGTTTSWGVSALYQPVRDVTLRGSYQRAVRAPNVTELFQPTLTGTTQITDPCDARFIAQGTSTRRANCAALGIPTNFQTPTIPITIATVTSGNPDLDVERGTTYSFGAVLQPSFIPRFSLSVDYYNIELKGAIAGVNSTTISPFRVPSQCVDAPTLDNPFCPLVERDAGFNITRVTQYPINLTRLTASGIDADLSYRMPLSSDAGISFRGLASYVIKRDDYRSPALPDFRTQIVETPSSPRFQATLATTLTLGPVELTHRARYFSSVYYKNDDVAFFESVNGAAPLNVNRRAPGWVKTGSYNYHDLRLGFDFGEGRSFYLGVDNLADKKPPFSIYGAGFGGAQFDSVGRLFYAGFRVAM
ncbi:TonB-dependent receptor [Sphingopyxis sp. YF1]|uniref:TonB-dependent receptor n=1 Tax=unclassified Sphingopyxis TaxID=2614943 RepID=UPI001F613535|nr:MULTISPECIES: TonB-dependent receptor [unclassified Sphingopyxis]UNU44610.1 TonB-dependent receptor [Sphingopyxis sp. YF1]USI76652.1 TonB-dependent receptor [Sphingopyxis sp. USTB-05]